ADASGAAGVDAYLGQRSLRLGRPLGQAPVRARAAGRHAVEQLRAVRRLAALQCGEVALGARVARADDPAGLDYDNAVGQACEDVVRVPGTVRGAGRHRVRV